MRSTVLLEVFTINLLIEYGRGVFPSFESLSPICYFPF